MKISCVNNLSLHRHIECVLILCCSCNSICSNGSCGVQCKSGYKYDTYQGKCIKA